MISTRVQLVAAILLTIAGIVAVSGYGWRALRKASASAEEAEQHLSRIWAVARLEEQIHRLNSAPGAPDPRELSQLHRVLAEVESAGWSSPADRSTVNALAEEIRDRMATGRVAGRWDTAANLVSKLEKSAIETSRETVEVETRGAARRRAVNVVLITVVVVLLFAALATVVFVRYRRERQRSLAALRKSDRLVALGTIAASVAHELNNPLGTIAGCAAAVRSRLEPKAGEHEDELEYLGMIVAESQRCSGIVGSLRDLGRDAPLAITGTRLDDLVREVVNLVRIDQGAKGIDFEVRAQGPVEILCDPDKIKQLLLNLLLNARDSSEPGGHVLVRVDSTGDGGARLSVEDEGHGIPKRELPHVFEAFRSGKPKGLGLGLFLCERIAALHGGRIVAESDGPARGARFTVTLPTQA